ncbi:MAG: penicillin-binding protein 1C, partial [Chthoniobacterales bacterium]
GHAPRITSPPIKLTVSHGSARNASMPLRAETETGVRRIYWFADKSFLGACDVKEVLCWKAAPGAYELTAIDDHGRSGSRVVTLQ